MSGARFYVQRPADECGNSWHPPAIIEAVETGVYGRCLRVIAPWEFAVETPFVRLDKGPYTSWVETEGPARMLSREEWVGLVEALDVLADPDAMAATEEDEAERGQS